MTHIKYTTKQVTSKILPDFHPFTLIMQFAAHYDVQHLWSDCFYKPSGAKSYGRYLENYSKVILCYKKLSDLSPLIF